jgi:hypothetical protein
LGQLQLLIHSFDVGLIEAKVALGQGGLSVGVILRRGS